MFSVRPCRLAIVFATLRKDVHFHRANWKCQTFSWQCQQVWAQQQLFSQWFSRFAFISERTTTFMNMHMSEAAIFPAQRKSHPMLTWELKGFYCFKHALKIRMEKIHVGWVEKFIKKYTQPNQKQYHFSLPALSLLELNSRAAEKKRELFILFMWTSNKHSVSWADLKSSLPPFRHNSTGAHKLIVSCINSRESSSHTNQFVTYRVKREKKWKLRKN